MSELLKYRSTDEGLSPALVRSAFYSRILEDVPNIRTLQDIKIDNMSVDVEIDSYPDENLIPIDDRNQAVMACSIKLLDALTEMHRRGIIHSIISRTTVHIDTDEPAIEDFSEAQLYSVARPKPITSYSAPELLDDPEHPPTSASDHWALGVVILEYLLNTELQVNLDYITDNVKNGIFWIEDYQRLPPEVVDLLNTLLVIDPLRRRHVEVTRLEVASHRRLKMFKNDLRCYYQANSMIWDITAIDDQALMSLSMLIFSMYFYYETNLDLSKLPILIVAIIQLASKILGVELTDPRTSPLQDGFLNAEIAIVSKLSWRLIDGVARLDDLLALDASKTKTLISSMKRKKQVLIAADSAWISRYSNKK